MKHLLYEQQNIIATLKSEHELTAIMQREQAAKREAELLNDNRCLKQKLKELELSYEDTLRQLKLDHAKDTTKMKHELDLSSRELYFKTDEKLQTERDELRAKFESSVFEVKQKCDLKNLLLEKKVQVLGENLEKKALTGLSNDENTQGELEKFVDAKNMEIKSLRFNLAKTTKAYNDVIKAFEIKLVEYGIPLEEMGLLHYISTA